MPFNRFPEADPVLGPEMRSTGEVMGIDLTTGLAFTKSQIAAGGALPEGGTVFLSLADRDKAVGLEAARGFVELGLDLAATSGTAEHLRSNALRSQRWGPKIWGEEGTDAVQLARSGAVQLVVNSPGGGAPRADGEHIRAAAGARVCPSYHWERSVGGCPRPRRLADLPVSRPNPPGVPPGHHFDSGANGS
ncbi:MAG: hypothetical protein CM1200mP26_30140 [Acidimicrobiales bacterium]|nr:MAG: hypothetical protein CM1200mP26_30140 [Acidimicrobiales bacterium]